jgi:hypothetical protein
MPKSNTWNNLPLLFFRNNQKIFLKMPECIFQGDKIRIIQSAFADHGRI